jgi:anti-sigma regulatory factor (Ser/Thr protein kinase)
MRHQKQKRVRERGEEIRHFILQQVESHPSDLTKLTAETFQISRQTAHGHLRRLISGKVLAEKGSTKGRTYQLRVTEWKRSYPLGTNTEDVAWNDVAPIIGVLPENVLSIWNTGFTEMFNNALDHSAGTEIIVELRKTVLNTELALYDNGIGIFKKIQQALKLPAERDAILELSKGKFTTDPEKHSGEGVFFTSRMFDSFDILSDGLSFTREPNSQSNWVVQRDHFKSGTAVWMKLDNHSSRTPAEVYNQYTDGDFGFDKTNVPIRLAQFSNQRLVSRSQAKRVLARIGAFKTVVFDFTGVETIGQAFADEIFRVFAKAHPEVQIQSTGANSDVSKMIQRAVAEK